MKLTSLILSAAACYSGILCAGAQENFSLWPRRPDELEQARKLLARQQWGEAVHLLQPFVHDAGVAGREARNMTGRVNVVRYLTRMHPDAAVYTVRRGDSLPKIAASTKCPVDMLMLYNGLVKPSDLKIDQKIVYVSLQLRIEIYPAMRELAVWDNNSLVASYKITALEGISEKSQNLPATTVKGRESYLHGSRIPGNSAQTATADKVLTLEDGTVISGRRGGAGKVVRLADKDMNELAQLVRESNKVLWLSEPHLVTPSDSE